MENQPTKLDKAVKISIILGFLIIALSIAFYLVWFLPRKELARIEQQKKEQEIQEKAEYKNKIDSCLNNSDAIRSRIDKDNNDLTKFGAFISLKDVFFDTAEQKCVYALETTFSGSMGEQSAYLIKDAITDRILNKFFVKTQEEEYKDFIKKHRDSFDFNAL